MTARLALGNLLSFGLQVTVLIGAGAALARAFRLDAPRAMLAFWRILLLACLLLPLYQPWRTVIPPELTILPAATARGHEIPAAREVAAAAPLARWPISDLLLTALAAGVAARLLWLAMGACSLRRLRREAVPLEPLPDSVRRAQERIGTRAGMFVSDRISGPITFGLFRPVVVFPPNVSAMPEHVQEAIAYHELLHVRRRDWLAEVLEEGVRAVLWFHPAIWWLIGRIRLTREQVVDEAAIQLTSSRARYVESLLAVALGGAPVSLTPASPFLRRQLLKKRVARILQETTMTTRRLFASLIVSSGALVVAGTLAARFFPLEAQGSAAVGGEAIQLVKGGEHLLHGDAPEYPARAAEQKVEGDVVVEMTLNDRGEVADARVVSGPEELRKATLQAVLQWHYAAAALSSTVTHATLRFRVPPGGFRHVERAEGIGVIHDKMHHDHVRLEHEAPHHTAEIEKALEDKARHDELQVVFEKMHADFGQHLAAAIEVAPEDHGMKHKLTGQDFARRFVEPEDRRQPLFEGGLRLAAVRAERVAEATATALLSQAEVAVGDTLTEDMARRIQRTARTMDEHLRVEFRKDGRGGLIVVVTTR